MKKIEFFCPFSKMKAVPPEPFLTKGAMSYGDVSDVHSVHEVSLGFGVTTDLSLWLVTPETDDGDTTHENATATPRHPLAHRPQKTDSVSGCERSAAVPDPASDGDQERKKQAERKRPVDQPQWEALVQEVVSAEPSLARILYPVVNRKTAVMLMEEMLSKDNLLMEDHYKKKQEQKVSTFEQSTHR